jgi:CRP/FNR family transcriptional regulator
MEHAKTKLWYLKNLEMFQQLSDEDRKLIQSSTNHRLVKRNETLYFEGEADDNVYILKEGAVKIMRHLPAGHEVITEVLGNGTVFGETVVDDASEKDESAVAVEDGVICSIRRKDFDHLTRSIPDLAIKVRKIQGLRRYKLENKLLDLLFGTVEQRLARTILGLLEDFGEERGGARVLKVKLTHLDFARLVASTRETVSAVFGRMREQGLLEFDNKYVVVPDVKRLEQLAASE